MNEQTSFEKPLVLIPAAGFGRRVGAPNSKEILTIAGGKPLIELAFGECEKRQWPVHLITRAEKTDLLSYCENRVVSGPSLNLQIQIVPETKEWTHTVLLSEPVWHEWNLLFLPDLAYAPLSVLDQIFSLIQVSKSDLIAAGQITTQPHVWGCLRINDGGFQICEKPNSTSQEWAWGFLAFRKHLGKPLFQALLESGKDHQWKSFRRECSVIELESMADLTR